MNLSPEDIILGLLQGSDGIEWSKKKDGWSKESPFGICYWDGIMCDSETETIVEGIYLPASGLIGTIPSELGLLTTLKEISMPKNIFFGTIPPLVAALPRLRVFDLAENDISGTLPIFSSPSLEKLLLSKNLITGTIHRNIGYLNSEMKEFDLFRNKIFGPIPASISEMKKLSLFSISNNMISGTIPSKFPEELNFLYMDNNNNLIGTITPSIANSKSQMMEVWLQNNMISGTVPATISAMEKLYNFYIDGNKLTGTIPKEICREGLNSDFFESVEHKEKVNFCEAVACPTGFVSLNGLYPCKRCEKKYFNPYLGRKGRCIDIDVKDILKDLYKSMGGQDWSGALEWDQSDYKDVDHCQFKGITCNLNGDIVKIDLKGMNLAGTIPESIGFLQYLTSLDLRDNNLTGFIPSDLRWTPLENLDLSGNQLKGSIPPMLCLKPGINGNGDGGEYGCDHIACPIGYYSSTGYSVRNDKGEMCNLCKGGGANYLASRTCTDGTLITNEDGNINGYAVTASIIAGLVVAFVFMFIIVKVVRERNEKSDKNILPQDEWAIE